MMSTRCAVILFLLFAPGDRHVTASVEFPTLDHLHTKVPPDIQEAAVKALATRALGDNAKFFQFKVDSELGVPNRDSFKLQTVQNVIHVTGTTGVAAAWGLQYYLKHYQGFHFSWGGDQKTWRGFRPVPDPGIKITSNDRFRYYQNVCTSSYSFVWWNWTRWEREIDWMALNGINLPLAFTGQEAIWQKVYLKLGLSQKDLDEHFAGPAFLAWGRMGNMRGFGGPIPQTWLDNQLKLQHQILRRMRELGMLPVLPGFAGHIPEGFTRVYPNVNCTRLGGWAGFADPKYCCTYLLDPNDPMFVKVGQAFIEEMSKEFNGTNHIYNADTFNEMTPSSGALSYISGAGKAVFKGMESGDPQAIWLMQAWLFLSSFWNADRAKALLTSVPQGRMILLDLRAELYPQYERFESFYGQPFIWCMLHDFGGGNYMQGQIEDINQGPFKARAYPNSSMIGIGLTPEGINQNDVIYEFMNENIAREKPVNTITWFMNYADRRYGISSLNVQTGWIYLMHSIYNCTDRHDDFSNNNIPTQRPRLSPPIKPDVWYDPKVVIAAWKYFVSDSSKLKSSDLFRYDLVDVTRQVLQLLGLQYYTIMITAYKSKNATLFNTTSGMFIELLTDMDTLLSSDQHFLLGAWIADAHNMAESEAERKLYEYNARNQVTLWGPNGEILDYAAKQWGGLVGKYYLPRWLLFINQLKEALSKGQKFNQTAFNKNVFSQVEQPFTFDTTPFPVQPQGDSVQVVRTIFKKYFPSTRSKFFKKLKQFTPHGKKYMKYATRWLKKNPRVINKLVEKWQRMNTRL
ncbi:alpha-N-acetylglucosaminidase isoform X3 [Lingula anatina]|uniref:Alpha-N-acetylglucosaminidase isoform X3 n=1 Tax=Lingula anatina TaxID=7574 RepID=A0A1S3J1K8_LINAN|nr:alpha-N-acetylglucosaminidase isoform X3 [Lingula anatina]|eukprot:XP_013404322.1 alpha-N-acetylglucosaminidase isoform X3 [Lingula anatina]